MSKLSWGADDALKTYQNGVDRVVLFPKTTNGTYPAGVAWEGVTAVNEKASGGESDKKYADNRAYLNLMSPEEFNATIEAFSSPEEFDMCDGTAEIEPGLLVTAQNRSAFGIAYRVMVGNEADGSAADYELHLVYDAKAKPSARNNATVGDKVEPQSLSWDITTKKEDVPGFQPSAHLIVRSSAYDSGKLAAIEALIYGSDSPDTPASLPTPAEVIAIVAA